MVLEKGPYMGLSLDVKRMCGSSRVLHPGDPSWVPTPPSWASVGGDPSPASPENRVLCCSQGQGGGGGVPWAAAQPQAGRGGVSVRVTLWGVALGSEPTGLLTLTAEGYVLEVKLERELRIF